jgi:hypothetical protein
VTTLLEYTRTEFPNHTVEVRYPDGRRVALLPDEDDTLVSRVASSRPGDRRDQRTGEQRPGEQRLGGQRPAETGRSDRPTRPPERPDVEDRTAARRRSAEAVAALDLVDHTVVAHVVGADATVALLDRMHDAGWERSIAILVEPETPHVVARGGENAESVTDLPDRRIAVAAGIGALVGVVAAGLLGLLVGDEPATAIITAGFGAVLGAVVGAMLGGLGRHAGEQAWSQPHVPGRTMGVVAAFVGDDAAAAEAVRLIEDSDPEMISVVDVRLVNAHGAWRSPMA